MAPSVESCPPYGQAFRSDPRVEFVSFSTAVQPSSACSLRYAPGMPNPAKIQRLANAAEANLTQAQAALDLLPHDGTRDVLKYVLDATDNLIEAVRSLDS